jgi:predicted phosphodiesterase
MAMAKIAVISDIHSNIHALKAAIDCIREERADRIVFLGDLLTYGCHPNEVVEELLALKAEHPLLCVTGNHDQFYFNSNPPGAAGFEYAHDFIIESIHWTQERVSYDIEKAFDWVENVSIDGVYFSHANPSYFGNWSYIRSEEDREIAFNQLRFREKRIGVFGHVHRHGLTVENAGVLRDGGEDYTFLNEAGEWGLALNYSVGQQRGDRPGLMFVEIDERGIRVSFRAIDYPVGPHLRAIENSGLSRATRERLISYFEERR